jgi:hypothetical protein
MQEDIKCIGLTRGTITLKVLVLREKGDQEVVGRVPDIIPQIYIVQSVQHSTGASCLFLQKLHHPFL